MKAYLIGEKSAGMTAVEIYNNNDNLVWSHMYFQNGATHDGYVNGLCQVVDDMINCADVDNYDRCDYDEEGDVNLYDDNDSTGVILSYDSDTQRWELKDEGDPRYYGQSTEVVDALMLAGLLDKDDEHEERVGEVETAIGAYILRQ